MDMILEKLKDLTTIYVFIIIFSIALFQILVDSKSLEKKKLKREQKISKFIGYAYIIVGITLFVVTRFIL